jgi:autotransporter adhesin
MSSTPSENNNTDTTNQGLNNKINKDRKDLYRVV